jgi:hypothetical protein
LQRDSRGIPKHSQAYSRSCSHARGNIFEAELAESSSEKQLFFERRYRLNLSSNA